MATVFEQIIAGDIPGRFAWADDVCVVFATIEPHAKGHVLVVPREPVDNFWDIDPDLFAHLGQVCQVIANAQLKAFGTSRIGQVIAGYGVPHLHIHLIPMDSEKVLSMESAYKAEQNEIDESIQKLREALVLDGYAEYVPKTATCCEVVDEDADK